MVRGSQRLIGRLAAETGAILIEPDQFVPWLGPGSPAPRTRPPAAGRGPSGPAGKGDLAPGLRQEAGRLSRRSQPGRSSGSVTGGRVTSARWPGSTPRPAMTAPPRSIFGGRVRKDDPHPRAYGAVDEAQAALGMVRAFTDSDELAGPDGRPRARASTSPWPSWRRCPRIAASSRPGRPSSTARWSHPLEALIDRYSKMFDPPTEFVLPGGTRVAAMLDVARTTMRRAERESLAVVAEDSEAGKYLNRLSDLLWVLARWQEGDSLTSRGSKEIPDEDE